MTGAMKMGLYGCVGSFEAVKPSKSISNRNMNENWILNMVKCSWIVVSKWKRKWIDFEMKNKVKRRRRVSIKLNGCMSTTEVYYGLNR